MASVCVVAVTRKRTDEWTTNEFVAIDVFETDPGWRTKFSVT